MLIIFCGASLLLSQPQADSLQDTARAAATAQRKTEMDEFAGEDFEDIQLDEVEDVTEQVTQAPAGFSIITLIGKFHPALVHFPLGWMFLLFLVELVAYIYNRQDIHRAGFYLLILTLLSFIPAIVSGLINASWTQGGTETHDRILVHRNLNFIVAGLALLALSLRLFVARMLSGKLRVLYLLALISGAIIILISGHIGSKLVFGENYLPF